MKRPWLILSIVLLVLGLVAPIVGLDQFTKAALAYEKVREQRRAEGKTEAYLSEVEALNRLAFRGFGAGAFFIAGSITTFVIHRKKKKAEGYPPDATPSDSRASSAHR